MVLLIIEDWNYEIFDRGFTYLFYMQIRWKCFLSQDKQGYTYIGIHQNEAQAEIESIYSCGSNSSSQGCIVDSCFPSINGDIKEMIGGPAR
jgi:hypothetical protein